jgi:hypothetical protein
MTRFVSRLALLLLSAVATVASANTFNLFGPVTGVLKGNANTYVTTAAASSDITALWSGCSGVNFLRGDGTCAVPSGTGVTSVGMTVPSGFTVTGSPVTSSGTLAVSFTTGQTANRFLATPDGTTGALSLRAVVAGDLPSISSGLTGVLPGANGGTNNGFMAFTGPATSLKTFTLPNASATILTSNAAVTAAQGGTGVATLTGIAKGNGTSPFTAAASSDVISLWSGTCNNTTFLRGDGSCNTTGSGTPANPTASVGLTAVNGVASTYMRSDGAPPIDQGIAPTWTATHTFSQAYSGSGVATFAQSIESTAPYVQFFDTNGTANNRRIRLGVNTTGFEILGMNDTGTSWPIIQNVSTSSNSSSLTLSANTIALAGGSSSAVATLNSVSISQTQHGVYSAATGTCTVASGSPGAGTCTYNGVGDYTVNWTQTFSGTPTCIANNVSNTGNVVARLSAILTTSVRVIMTLGTTGAAQEASFTVICTR